MHSSSVIFAGLFAGFAAFGAVAGSNAAQAQPAGDVIVHPLATGRQVLLYPGGEFMRVVPPLLQPGQKSGPIHLHMPSRRRPARQAEAPKPKPAPKVAEAAPAPAPKPSSSSSATGSSSTSSSGGGAASGYVSGFGPGNLFGGPPMTLHPKNAPPPQAAPKPPPTRIAKAAPPPPSSLPGLTRRSVILFAKDASEPMDSALDQIRFLAGDLNAAMVRPASRIELQAFGGDRGDKGSDARRLSLKRALAIRQVLIDDGVSAGRIDVRAMGGASNGPADRVDIYIKA
jgi:outer membrane protein OmpA-like peptidoglycan-associated protein